MKEDPQCSLFGEPPKVIRDSWEGEITDITEDLEPGLTKTQQNTAIIARLVTQHPSVKRVLVKVFQMGKELNDQEAAVRFGMDGIAHIFAHEMPAPDTIARAIRTVRERHPIEFHDSSAKPGRTLVT